MGFEPVQIRVRFDGHVFVPETPVDLPVGTWVTFKELPPEPGVAESEPTDHS